MLPPLFLGWLFSIIGTIFVSVGGVVLDVLRVVRPVLDALVTGIRVVVDRIGQNAGRFFRAIARGTRSLFSGVLSPAVQSLRQWYERFRRWLQRVFAPIIRIFEWVNEVLDKIWSRVIAPVLDVIQRLRQVFALLGELGLGFASAVEEFLARIEREIFNGFQTIRTWVNTASFWFDLLLDPRGWIRSTPFLNTVFRYGGNIVNLIVKLGGSDPQIPVRLERFRSENPSTGVAQSAERFRSGEMKERFTVQQAAARFRSRTLGA